MKNNAPHKKIKRFGRLTGQYLKVCDGSFGWIITLNTSIMSTTRGSRGVISGSRGRRSRDRSTRPLLRSCDREINIVDVVDAFEVSWRDVG